MSSLVILAASLCEISCGKAADCPTQASAIGVVNKNNIPFLTAVTR